MHTRLGWVSTLLLSMLSHSSQRTHSSSKVRQPADDDEKSAIWFSDTWRADVRLGAARRGSQCDDVNFYWIMKNISARLLKNTAAAARFSQTDIKTHSLIRDFSQMCFTLIDLPSCLCALALSGSSWNASGYGWKRARKRKIQPKTLFSSFASDLLIEHIREKQETLFYIFFLCLVWFFLSFRCEFSFSSSSKFSFPSTLPPLPVVSSRVSVVCHTCHVVGNVRIAV